MCGLQDFLILSVTVYGGFAVALTGYRTARRWLRRRPLFVPAWRERACARRPPVVESGIRP